MSWDLAPQLFLLPVLVSAVATGRPLLPRALYMAVQGFGIVGQSLVERLTLACIQLGEIRETLRRMQVTPCLGAPHPRLRSAGGAVGVTQAHAGNSLGLEPGFSWGR